MTNSTAQHSTAQHSTAQDIVASIIIFISSSLLTGRVFRYPFDDEIFTLTSIENSKNFLEFSEFFLKGGDVHPPLSYWVFYVLNSLGFSENLMRIFSLSCTAFSIGLLHFFTLNTLNIINKNSFGDRLIAVTIFGLIPLAISQGDALRWYPLFCLFSALFFYIYLNNSTDKKFLAAIPLGLAASTNFLAALILIPFLLYRYIFERRFDYRFELKFFIVLLVFSIPGIFTFSAIFSSHWGGAANSQLSNSIMSSLMTNIVGFFGGHTLGISQSWALLPAVLATFWLSYQAWLSRKENGLINLFLLVIAISLVASTVAGFAKPRSFLYLAPLLSIVIIFGINECKYRYKNLAHTLIVYSLILIPSIGVIANLKFNNYPFKRNSVIQFGTIIDFIEINKKGDAIIVSTDPNIAYILSKSNDYICVSYFDDNNCLKQAHNPQTVFFIEGHSSRFVASEYKSSWEKTKLNLLLGKELVAKANVGVDDDSSIKSKITGLELSKNILSVSIYR